MSGTNDMINDLCVYAQVLRIKSSPFISRFRFTVEMHRLVDRIN